MEHDLTKNARADVMSVSDEPHDWYAPHKHHPESEIPVTYDTERGNVLLKEVEYSTIQCPECDDVDAYKNERGTPQCPECGMLCTSPKKPDHEVVADPKTAERVDDNGNFIK